MAILNSYVSLPEGDSDQGLDFKIFQPCNQSELLRRQTIHYVPLLHLQWRFLVETIAYLESHLWKKRKMRLIENKVPTTQCFIHMSLPKKCKCWGYMGRPWNPPFPDISIGFLKWTPKSSKSWMTGLFVLKQPWWFCNRPLPKSPNHPAKIPAKITMQSLANHHFYVHEITILCPIFRHELKHGMRTRGGGRWGTPLSQLLLRGPASWTRWERGHIFISLKG